MAPVYTIGTMDTKGSEIDWLARRVRDCGVAAMTIDVGTSHASDAEPDVDRRTVASFHPGGVEAVLGLKDRGEAVTAMSIALERFLLSEFENGKMSGAIGMGGTGGTALISPGFRKLPIGFPKVLLSTVASGNTRPYVGTSDILMMNSVVDVAGLNTVSKQVFSNAAHAIAGMVKNRTPYAKGERSLGMTMFGVTTPCVNMVREKLEKEWECLVFHATGIGGQTMEKLVSSGLIQSLLDLTTTEVADEVVGGVFPAGPDRFDILSKAAIPCVMSLGALDMVNFGSMETVPQKFQNRKLHVHNAQVTLMRTTVEENLAIARWIANKINHSVGPLTLLIPEGGVSLLDEPGKPFYDPEADEALFSELEKLLEIGALRKIIRLPFHINDPLFAAEAVKAFNEITH